LTRIYSGIVSSNQIHRMIMSHKYSPSPDEYKSRRIDRYKEEAPFSALLSHHDPLRLKQYSLLYSLLDKRTAYVLVLNDTSGTVSIYRANAPADEQETLCRPAAHITCML